MLVFNAGSALVSRQTQQLTSAALNNYEPLRLRVVVPQDGYVTAYVGNESEVDVYFDDVTVEHRQGLQVQETQYDPMGLELAGLTRPTPGLKPLNQYRWNGKEFQADLGLNWTQLDWRMVDPQIGGGFHVVDPEVENGQEHMSPYVFGFDNAVRYNDPDGRCPGGCPPAPDPTIMQQVGAATAAVVTSLAEGLGVIAGTVSAATVATGAAVVAVATGLGYAVLKGGETGAYGGGSSYGPMGIPSAQIYRSQGLLPQPPQGTNNGGNNSSANTATGGNAPKPSRMEQGKKAAARAAEGKPSSGSTDFVVNQQGEAVAIPNGARGPSSPQKGTGMSYQGGKGGKGMNNRTTGVRIMDANANQGRRVNHMNTGGQTVDPKSGNTIPNNDPRGHQPYGQ